MCFNRAKKAAVLGAMLVLMSACATMDAIGEKSYSFFQNEKAVPVLRMAVVPFENLTPRRTAGVIVSTLFYSELSGEKSIDLVQESAVRAWLSSHKLTAENLADSFSAQSVGAELQADRVLLGSVHRYGNSGADLFGKPSVAISARLIDVHSGKVLWAMSETDVVSTRFWSDKQTIEGLTQSMVADLSESLLDLD